MLPDWNGTAPLKVHVQLPDLHSWTAGGPRAQSIDAGAPAREVHCHEPEFPGSGVAGVVCWRGARQKGKSLRSS